MSESRIEGQKLATISMKKAAKRSQAILTESSSSIHKEDEQEESEVENEEENGDEQEPVDQLYKLYYKKFINQELNDEEKALLKRIMKNKTCIKNILLGLGANTQDDMMLKLFLSNIINLIHPESYEVLKKILTKNEMKTIDKSNLDLHVGLSDGDENMLKKVLKSGGTEANTDLMMIEILTEPLKLSKAGAMNSDTYKLLNILRCVIENIANWSEHNSELTSYRHCAKILISLFTGTDLKILDGDPRCLAAKEQMIVNHSLSPFVEENVLSTCSIRKIDAMFMFKNHLEKLAAESVEGFLVNSSASRLKGVTRSREKQVEATCETPRIMFSPKQKKRKLNLNAH